MTPQSIAGLTVPPEQISELLDALAQVAEPDHVFELPKAA